MLHRGRGCCWLSMLLVVWELPLPLLFMLSCVAPHLCCCCQNTHAGNRHDVVYTNTTEADIKFCPGSRTHFEFFQREVRVFVPLPGGGVWCHTNCSNTVLCVFTS